MADWNWLLPALAAGLIAFLLLRRLPGRADRQEQQILAALRRHPHDGLSAFEVSRIAYVGAGRTFEILWRLTDEGVLTAAWDEEPDAPDRPRRRRYRLTSPDQEARYGR